MVQLQMTKLALGRLSLEQGPTAAPQRSWMALGERRRRSYWMKMVLGMGPGLDPGLDRLVEACISQRQTCKAGRLGPKTKWSRRRRPRSLKW